MKSSVIVIFFLVLLMFFSCVTTKSMHDKATDPVESNQIERRLRTQGDIDYWKKVKENNESAIIILDDP